MEEAEAPVVMTIDQTVIIVITIDVGRVSLERGARVVMSPVKVEGAFVGHSPVTYTVNAEAAFDGAKVANENQINLLMTKRTHWKTKSSSLLIGVGSNA